MLNRVVLSKRSYRSFTSTTISTHFRSVNPVSNTEFFSRPLDTNEEVEKKLQKAHHYFKGVGRHGIGTIGDRIDKLSNVHALLGSKLPELAELMTLEMGKPIGQAQAEVEKCAGHIEYMIQHAESFIEDEALSTRQHKAFVATDPIGPIVDIVPWNFPLWMPFKSMIAPLLLGNPILLKPSPQTPQSGAAIEKIFFEAGFNAGEFQALFTDNDETLRAVAHPSVRGVKFTGSTAAGKIVAQNAGAHLKKACLELGGADPFIVLEDSDLTLAVQKAYISRMVNNGQACINAKRFIVVEQVYDDFVQMLKKKIEADTVMGDPLLKEVNLGPLVSLRHVDALRKQLEDSKAAGCHEVPLAVDTSNVPSEGDTSCFFSPALLEKITEDSPAFSQEFFGPVFSMFKVKTEADAITLANGSEYGLGAAVFSKDIERAEYVARQLDAGMLYVNDFVQSQHDVPSGGCKSSGYGRECFKDGFHDLSNRKSIVVEKQS